MALFFDITLPFFPFRLRLSFRHLRRLLFAPFRVTPISPRTTINALSPISRKAVRLPELKYGERRAGVCAYLCIGIVNSKTLTFRETIALQRFVLSIGIGFHTAVATALRQLAIARRILPERTVIL